MTCVKHIIHPLLIAVAVHTGSCFVSLSPSRIKTSQRIERLSPAFATVANSTLSTATKPIAKNNRGSENIKHTYKVGELNEQTHSVYTNQEKKFNRTVPSSTIKKIESSSNPRNSTRNSNNNVKNYNHKQTKKNSKQKRCAKVEQFQWLHWIYNQWKDTSPGDLTDENVIKQMIAAVPKWSKRKSTEAAKRAEGLLERLIQEAVAGNPHMRTKAMSPLTTSEEISSAPPAMLSVSLFNAAMDAYGKIGNPSGVQRILRRMEGLRTSGVHDFACLEPDEFTMSTLATAWAKSHSEEAAQKAEAIIQYMDFKGLVPNTITYNSVLHAIAVGNQCDKALRAEDIVNRMKQRHEEKGEDCEPDVYTYQSLIQAWSRTSIPGSPQKAERILLYMDNEASSGKKNCKRLAPNAYCFTTVIHSWARSSERNRARHAYQLLNVMTRRYHDAKSEFNANSTKKNKSYFKLLKPNVKTFTSVLNACARPVDESEKQDAFAIAKLAMAQLSVGTYGKPNFLSYAAYLAVCGTTLDVGPERDFETEKTFRDCIKAGQVGQIVLEKLYLSASPEHLHELIGDQLDEQGQISIPRHWNRSTEGERAGGGNSLAQTEVDNEVVSKIPKAFQQRLEDVQSFGGRSSIYSESSGRTVVGKGGDEILWSKDEFSWSAGK